MFSAYSRASSFHLKLFFNNLFFLLLFFITFFISSCTTLQTASKIEENKIKYITFTDEKTQAKINAAFIDFDSYNIEICSTQPAVENQNTFNAESTLNFATRTNSSAAINTTPFSYPEGLTSKKRILAGLYIADGLLISEPIAKYSAILFHKENDSLYASIIDEQKTENISDDVIYAFGGFWTILRNKEIIKFKKDLQNTQDSRSAIGIYDNGKKLILFTVDNPLPGNSYGTSFEDTARILLSLGAEDAIMMDGGSSSSLVIDSKQLTKSFLQIEPALNLGFIIH